jgi:hypothetical protein
MPHRPLLSARAAKKRECYPYCHRPIVITAALIVRCGDARGGEFRVTGNRTLRCSSFERCQGEPEIAVVPTCPCTLLIFGMSSAWCTDQVRSCSDPHSRSGSDNADIARASQLQHAVEDMHSYVNFSHPTFVST